MSYSSRVYRQRNVNTHEEQKTQPFFAMNNTKMNSIQRLATSQEDEQQDTNEARMAQDKKIQRMPDAKDKSGMEIPESDLKKI